MAATIRDVARRAGVSIKTVSRVINNEAFVSEETRANVIAVMQELGYTPNISAQRLARGCSYVLGLVFHDATWDYIGDVLRGMLDEGHTSGYEALLHPCNIEHPTDRDAILQLAMQQRVDGFVFTPPCDNVSGLLAKLQAWHIPFVRLTPSDRQMALPYVTADDRQGAYTMTRYLLHRGHRRIGFVMGNPDHRASHDRFAGFEAALEEEQIPLDPALVKQGDFQFHSGVACGRELLNTEPRPTAIFASNDDMAAGVLSVAHQFGIAVPEELSVAGFDDTRIARQVWPPLTTVRQPIYDIARLATQLLIRLLKQEPVNTLYYSLPTELVVRDSTGGGG